MTALYVAQRGAYDRSSKVGASVTAALSANTTDVFTWTAPSNITINSQTPAAVVATATSTITFNAPVVGANEFAGRSLFFSVVAGTGAAASDVATALTIVRPPPDIMSLTAVLFRCNRHRMVLTATSSVIDSNVQLSLQTYTGSFGNLFNPASSWHSVDQQQLSHRCSAKHLSVPYKASQSVCATRCVMLLLQCAMPTMRCQLALSKQAMTAQQQLECTHYGFSRGVDENSRGLQLAQAERLSSAT
eukprot:18978-Heterococcus_DN1.PRE.2